MAVKLTVIAKRPRGPRSADVEVEVAAAEATLPPWTRALLDCLRPTLREVLVLREAGRPGTRIAELLGISSQRVYALHAEAVRALSDAAHRVSLQCHRTVVGRRRVQRRR